MVAVDVGIRFDFVLIAGGAETPRWHRIDKDLHLHSTQQ